MMVKYKVKCSYNYGGGVCLSSLEVFCLVFFVWSCCDFSIFCGDGGGGRRCG